ncbi:odorant receptor 94b-like [Phlebotomus papatasi]|uniref:odorant receptor 94b-like n=1 Tax=Phlebotomus papatasi TaxID=29031 RepID=UPI00248454AE|nr:odorant receptor 94b-like [Phlebotomus papatasi]
MADLTKCYSEFIKIENFLNFLMKIIRFSIIPRNILFGFERYTIIYILIYYNITSFIALSYFKGTMMEGFIIIVMLLGLIQAIVKLLVPLNNEKELNGLLLWIRALHQDYSYDFVTQAARIHFSTIQFVIKIFMKIIFTVYVVAGVGVISYANYTDLVIHAIPWMSVKENESHIYHYIHQTIILPSATAIIVAPECILITIGFYFIGIQYVFRDMIQHLDDSNLKNKRQFLRAVYNFHSTLLKKFKIFNDIYFYVLTIQAGSSAFMVVLIFYVIRIETNIIFVPLIIAILLQFALLCFFGDLIYSKTEDIFTNLYLTKWYEFNVSDQNVFLMMMIISQNPFGLKAAGMYDINIVMFIQVIKAGISICAILYAFT